jgi:hypothetical protein
MLFAPPELWISGEDLFHLILGGIEVSESDWLGKDEYLGVALEALENADLEDGLRHWVEDLEDVVGLEVDAAGGHFNVPV